MMKIDDIIEAIAFDLRGKGYDAKLTSDSVFLGRGQRNIQIGKIIVRILDGKFNISSGVGILFNDIDISDPKSVDLLYLAIEYCTKINNHLEYARDDNVSNKERVKRGTYSLEIEAGLLREYYLKRMEIHNERSN